MTDSHNYGVYDIVVDGAHRYFASYLPHDIGFTAGLSPQAIIGEFTHGPDELTPEAFQQNSHFMQFMADVIGKHASDCPGLIEVIEREQNGFVYILDERTQTPGEDVPPEDIIGGLEIENGEVLEFHGSQDYRILTEDGFMKLNGWLQERLIEELIAIADGDDGTQPE